MVKKIWPFKEITKKLGIAQGFCKVLYVNAESHGDAKIFGTIKFFGTAYVPVSCLRLVA